MALTKSDGLSSYKVSVLFHLIILVIVFKPSASVHHHRRALHYEINETQIKELSKEYKDFINSLVLDGPSLKTRRHLGHVGHIPTATQRVYLYCRTGFFLQILPSRSQYGKVNGTSNPLARAALLELHIFNHQVRQVKGVTSGRYLSMTHSGRLVSTSYKSDLGFFRENEEENDWYTYNPVHTAPRCGRTRVRKKSLREWFIAIKENGSLRKPCRTKPGQQATQFIWIKERKLKHILKRKNRS